MRHDPTTCVRAFWVRRDGSECESDDDLLDQMVNKWCVALVWVSDIVKYRSSAVQCKIVSLCAYNYQYHHRWDPRARVHDALDIFNRGPASSVRRLWPKRVSACCLCTISAVHVSGVRNYAVFLAVLCAMRAHAKRCYVVCIFLSVCVSAYVCACRSTWTSRRPFRFTVNNTITHSNELVSKHTHAH